jgi:O-antigen ligase
LESTSVTTEKLEASVLALLLLFLAIGSMLFGFNTAVGTIFPHRILIFIGIILVLGTHNGRQSLIGHRHLLAFILVLIVMLLMVGAVQSSFISCIKSALKWFELYCLFLLGLTLGRSTTALRYVYGACFIVLVVNLVSALSPEMFTKILLQLELPRTDEQIVWIKSSQIRGDMLRIRGTFHHSLSLGAFTATLFAFLIQCRSLNLVKKKIGMVMLVLSTILCGLTLSRTPFLIILLIFVMYLCDFHSQRTIPFSVNQVVITEYERKQALRVLGITILLIVILFFLLLAAENILHLFFPNGIGYDTSMSIRYERFFLGLEMFASNPLIGHGFGHLDMYEITMDNYVLAQLIQVGVIGTTITLLIFFSLFKFKPFRLKYVFVAGLMLLIGFDFWGFWDSGGTFWLLCGLLASQTATVLLQHSPNCQINDQ